MSDIINLKPSKVSKSLSHDYIHGIKNTALFLKVTSIVLPSKHTNNLQLPPNIDLAHRKINPCAVLLTVTPGRHRKRNSFGMVDGNILSRVFLADPICHQVKGLYRMIEPGCVRLLAHQILCKTFKVNTSKI